MYRIRLDAFEGPFDLLVYLIENAQMDIRDIEISKITDQYIEYIEHMQKLNISLAKEFMVMAASLLEMKSKMLLPRVETLSPLEEPMDDPRREFSERLLEYKRFKAAAKILEKKEATMLISYSKPQEDLTQYTKEEDVYLKLGIEEFLVAFTQFLEKSRRVEEVRKHYTRLERARISVEMKIESIFNFFKRRLFRPLFFSELVEKKADGKPDSYDTVLTFSSVLQMLKEGKLMAEQEYTFGEIELSITDENEKM